MTRTFTTADADRLLGLADQFLSDWADDAVQAGEPDPEYEERNAEWEAIRPVLVAAPALLAALEDILGDRPDIQGGICQRCGRDYTGEISTGNCPSDDCPAYIARAAIAKARGESCEDDTPEEACTCHQRSWYGPHHDTQCPLAEPVANAKGKAATATPTCADRAAWAEKAVTAYARAKEGREYDPVADMASDLFTDLCHLLVREGISPDLILERAKTHYEEECAEEGIII